MASKSAELILKIKSVGADALDKIKENFDTIKEAGTIAFAAISAIVVKSLMSYREAEESTNALSRAMSNAGVYSKELRDAYLEQASSLSKLTTFGDDAIVQAQTTLQTYLKELTITPELTKATLDLAAAKKIDLASAAEIVGKSIGTSTNALAKQGIEIDATASKQEKLAQVIEAVNSKMGGQAQAAASGLGVFVQLQNNVGELFETLGSKLAPLFTVIGQVLNKVAMDTGEVNGAMNMFVSIIGAVVNAADGVITAFVDMSKALGGSLGIITSAMAAAMSGNFKEALGIAKSGFSELQAESDARMAARAERQKAYDDALNIQKEESRVQDENNLRESLIRKDEINAENALNAQLKKQEQDIAQQELDIAMMNANGLQLNAIQLAQIDKQIQNATNGREKKRLMEQKYNLLEQKALLTQAAFQAEVDKQKEADRANSYARIATLQNSNNRALAFAGKAAAMTQIAIDTPVAITKTLAAFPYPFNIGAAALVGAAAAAQAARIAGVPLAEGGIVQARPGGIQATIGEGGQDEAVIPLDRAGEFGLGGGGGNVTIIVNGGMLGTESEAYEFAKAVDRELLKLRQNNESTAFDSRVI